MGRSGSSALARVLGLCGGALPLVVLPPNVSNPTGFWEPQEAIALNDEFLAEHGSSWFDARVRLTPPSLERRRAFIERIASFLRRGFPLGGPIVLKEPRITALLDYWVEGARRVGLNVKVLHLYRDPAEVAASLAVRDSLSADHAGALWLKYNLLAENDTRGLPRALVSYQSLLEDARGTTARCAARLGLALETGDERAAAIQSFLSRDLQHHRGSRPAMHDRQLAVWIDYVYAVMQRGTLNASAEALDAIRTQFAEHYLSAA